MRRGVAIAPFRWSSPPGVSSSGRPVARPPCDRRKVGASRGRLPGPMSDLLPVTVRKFREQLRPKAIGPRYQGWLHFTFTSLGSWSVILYAVSRLHEVHAAEWLVI